jgi:hypothetical protein
MTDKPYRYLMFMLLIIVFFLSILVFTIKSHADERHDDQLPKDYQKAEDIMAKKKKSDHHGAYYLIWPPFWEKQKNSTGHPGDSNQGEISSQPSLRGATPDIPAIALAMLHIPPPPPRDHAHEPGVQFVEGVSQEFIAWATQTKQAKK